MLPKTVLDPPLIIAALWGVVFGGLMLSAIPVGEDFATYYMGAVNIVRGHSPYHPPERLSMAESEKARKSDQRFPPAISRNHIKRRAEQY